jgi:hypothetical protein
MSHTGQRIRDRLLADLSFEGDETDRLVGAVLATYVDDEGRTGPISLDTLARQIRSGQRTVLKRIYELEKLGILTVDDALTPPITFLRYHEE